jgi:uncharacterized protein (TIGR03435 family)
MGDRVARNLAFSRKFVLSLAGWLALAVLVLIGLVAAAESRAQAGIENTSQSIDGTWQGTLHGGQDLRLVFKISKAVSGGYTAVLYSIDQGGDGLPVTKTNLDGATVKMTLALIDGTFEGKLSPDGKTIAGTWTQRSNPLPLDLARATPETEWTIPPPQPQIPPMDANANPSFEVASIKPSNPDDQRKAFVVRGRHFQIVNQPVAQILCFAYDVQAKQLIGLPAWAETDKYDIDAQPNLPGAPSSRQWKGMLQKLLVERFKVTFHRDKKELAVYVLSVAHGGPKLTKSDADPNGLPAMGFRQLGELTVHNATITDFVTSILQGVVLDRPVLNHTGIAGKYDFTLNWTPDNSQFSGMGAKVPPASDGASALPNLYTAIQEQLGLKLEATKAPADVLVIDHVEKPSENNHAKDDRQESQQI